MSWNCQEYFANLISKLTELLNKGVQEGVKTLSEAAKWLGHHKLNCHDKQIEKYLHLTSFISKLVGTNLKQGHNENNLITRLLLHVSYTTVYLCMCRCINKLCIHRHLVWRSSL